VEGDKIQIPCGGIDQHRSRAGRPRGRELLDSLPNPGAVLPVRQPVVNQSPGLRHHDFEVSVNVVVIGALAQGARTCSLCRDRRRHGPRLVGPIGETPVVRQIIKAGGPKLGHDRLEIAGVRITKARLNQRSAGDQSRHPASSPKSCAAPILPRGALLSQMTLFYGRAQLSQTRPGTNPCRHATPSARRSVSPCR
jgi:hypothetical protein